MDITSETAYLGNPSQNLQRLSTFDVASEEYTIVSLTKTFTGYKMTTNNINKKDNNVYIDSVSHKINNPVLTTQHLKKY